MQFKLTDLLWLTAYFAVGAWLYSLGIHLAVLIWLGTVFGFEIGSRSDYPTVLLTICGSVFGLAVSMAVFLTTPITANAGLFMRTSMARAQLGLAAVTWLVAAGIFIWLVTRLKKQPVQPTPTDLARARNASE